MTLARTLLTFAAFAAPAAARGDLVYFKRGGEIQIAATRSGSKVTLHAPGGAVEFEASDFKKLVPGHDAPSEWPAKLAAAQKGGPSELFAAAWWALENGLTPEAVSTLRAVHSADPKLEPAAALVKLLDRIAPPLADPEDLASSVPRDLDLEISRSPHFLIHHERGAPGVAERLDLLERIYTTYYLTFAAQGLELRPPRRRLVGLIFPRQDAYVAYLKRENAAAFATTLGYYHPTRNLVACFNVRDLPEQRTLRARVDARAAEVERWRSTIAAMPAQSRLNVSSPGEPSRSLTRAGARAWLEEQTRDLARLRLLQMLDGRSLDLGMAAHETVHQLVANSGLAPQTDALPTWLHEGLAMQFEVIRGGRWSGVGRVHDLRLPDYRTILPAPRLLPLIRDLEFGHGYRRDLYAQAWSLVYFLRKQHPHELTLYLDLLRTPNPQAADRSLQHLDSFRTSFGDDLSKFEAEWHRYLRTLETPLESSPQARPEKQIHRN